MVYRISHRTIALVAAAALIGVACVSTDALARGGGRAGGGHAGGYHGGVHTAGYHRGYHGAYVRKGVGVAIGAAAVGGAIYNRAQCGYYPYPPCY